jgi:RNA polymerase sigma-70 factor, Bacteroides expansion family 1
MAFDVLYKRYVVQLLRLVEQKIGSQENAKEITQDVFMAVYLQKYQLQNIENLKAYIFSMAKHKVFNYYRHELVKQKYQQTILKNEMELLTGDMKEMLEMKQLLELVNEQIEHLPPKCREVFKLSRQANLSYKSIAQKLNISENTVDQHIQKALRILRAAIKNYEGHNSLGIVISVLWLLESGS